MNIYKHSRRHVCRNGVEGFAVADSPSQCTVLFQSDCWNTSHFMSAIFLQLAPNPFKSGKYFIYFGLETVDIK